MRTWAWAVPAVLGLALMILSFDRLLKVDPEAPWAYGFLCIGQGEPAKPLDVGTRISTRLRYLPASASGQAMLKGLGGAAPETRAALEARFHPKLIELPVDAMSLLAGRLREGRLPERGKDEVLAGSQAPHEDQLNIAGLRAQGGGSSAAQRRPVLGQLPCSQGQVSRRSLPQE